MKNLPDDELFGKLKNRLQNFEELPDDDIWDNIASSISTSEPKWIRISERIGLSLLILIAFGAWYASVSWGPVTSMQNENAGRSGVPFADEGVAPLAKEALAEEVRSSELNSPARTSMQREEKRSHQQLEMTSSQKVAPLANSGNISRHQLRFNHNEYDDHANRSRHAKSDGLASENGKVVTAPAVQPITTQDKRDVAGNDDALMTLRNIAQDSSSYDRDESPLTNASTTNSKVTTSADSALTPSGPSPFNPKRRRKDGWTLYALATPSLAFQHVKPSGADELTFAGLNSPGVLSKERFSFSFEAGAQFPLGKHLAAFGGLTYYHQSIDLSLMQTTDGMGSMAQNASLDYNFDPNLETTVVNYDMRNIGATAGLSYIISTGRLVHRLGGSMQYELGLTRTSSESSQDRTDHFINYRIFYRVEYGINERMTLFVQPSFTRSLLYHEVMDGALDVKQSRAGFGVGVAYRF